MDVVESLRAPLSDDLVALAPGAAARVASDAQLGSSSHDLQQQLVQVARQVLGDHAGWIVAQIESRGDSAELLSASVDVCFKLIRLTIDEKKADDFQRRALRILSTRE